MSGFALGSSLVHLPAEDFPYSDKVVSTIRKNRGRHMEKRLFIDLIIGQVTRQESAYENYPPSNIAHARKLSSAIESSPADELKRQSVEYYLSKDWSLSEQYAESTQIPEPYRILMDGYWALDRFQFEEAHSCLTDSSVIPDFPVKILKTFATCDRQGGFHKAVSFVESCRPALANLEDMRTYYNSLLHVDPASAVLYQRDVSEDLRTLLLQDLFEFLVQDPAHASLVFSVGWREEEEGALKEVCRRQGGDAQKLYKIYLIQIGRLAEARKIDFGRDPNSAGLKSRNDKMDIFIRHLEVD